MTIMVAGEPTDELTAQAYVSTLYPKRYSGLGHLYHSTVIHEMLDGVTPPARILDVGCGTGFVSRLYPHYDITGIDISKEMLSQHPGNHLEAPAENIPFADNTFDVVLCRSLLHHLEDPAKGLAEMVRVLNDGGEFICWEPNLSIFNDWIRKLAKRTRRFSHWHKNFEPKELRELITSAGLTITDKKYHGHLAYTAIGFPDIWSVPMPHWMGKALITVDDLIAKTPLGITGWAVRMKATKT